MKTNLVTLVAAALERFKRRERRLYILFAVVWRTALVGAVGFMSAASLYLILQ